MKSFCKYCNNKRNEILRTRLLLTGNFLRNFHDFYKNKKQVLPFPEIKLIGYPIINSGRSTIKSPFQVAIYQPNSDIQLYYLLFESRAQGNFKVNNFIFSTIRIRFKSRIRRKFVILYVFRAIF